MADEKECEMLDEMKKDQWVESWYKGRTDFHEQAHNFLLVKHLDTFLDGKTNQKIFFPFCGKDTDMKWFYDMGHSVVGVEFIEQAVEQFMEEQNIQLHKSPLPGIEGHVFKSTDGRLAIYCCDFFEYNKSFEGQFDGIWDRGALNACNKGDRTRYAVLMKSLMKPDTRYFIHSFYFDSEDTEDYLKEEYIRELYGDVCDITLLDKVDHLEPEQKAWGIDHFWQMIHLLKLKR